MIIGDRIEACLAAKGWSQAELARRVGVSQQTIWKLVSGGSTTSKYLVPIARELETSPEYLLGEVDDPSLTGIVERPSSIVAAKLANADPDTVELNEFDLSFGLGSAFIHDVPVTGVRRVFSRSWIRNFTNSPFEYLMFATGIGDSMTPTILDADIVLIDTFDRTPRFADKIWAIEMGGLGSIKRLRPTKDGQGMRLLSSNPDVPEDVAYDGEMQIVGRVAGVFRKI